jgi:hypothetical protein
MSDSEAETREVEMVDAVEEQEQQEERTKMNGGDAHSEDDTSVASAKSKPDDDHVDGADHVMTSGHITPDDPERKTDDEEQDIASTSVSDEPKPSIAAPLNVPLLNGHSEHPIPSVETDEPAADEQQPEPSNAHMKSPAVETRPSHKASGSPNRQRSNVPNNNRHSEMDSIKRDKEIARVMEVIKEVSPEALQQVLRKNWRLFLFEGYAEDHVAFILRVRITFVRTLLSPLPNVQSHLATFEFGISCPFPPHNSQNTKLTAHRLGSKTQTSTSSSGFSRTIAFSKIPFKLWLV